MRYLFPIMIIVFSAVSFAGESAVKSKAVLTVEVTNGTADGDSVEGDGASLKIYHHEQLMHQAEAAVDANGNAFFEDIPTGEHQLAVVSVEHQNMRFTGQSVSLNTSEENFLTSVTVFDVSADTSALSVQTHHLIVKIQADALAINEYMQLENSSSKAIRPDQSDEYGKPVVLKIMLPAGFKNLRSLRYFEEHALVKTDYGFYDTMAIPPGTYDINFSYTLDIDSNPMNIVKGISLPTSSLIIFAKLGSLELTGLGQQEQMTAADGSVIQYYRRTDVAPEKKINFQITGFKASGSNLSTWLILAIVFATVLGLAILRLQKDKT